MHTFRDIFHIAFVPETPIILISQRSMKREPSDILRELPRRGVGVGVDHIGGSVRTARDKRQALCKGGIRGVEVAILEARER